MVVIVAIIVPIPPFPTNQRYVYGMSWLGLGALGWALGERTRGFSVYKVPWM